jgi:hypothetical protein
MFNGSTVLTKDILLYKCPCYVPFYPFSLLVLLVFPVYGCVVVQILLAGSAVLKFICIVPFGHHGIPASSNSYMVLNGNGKLSLHVG